MKIREFTAGVAAFVMGDGFIEKIDLDRSIKTRWDRIRYVMMEEISHLSPVVRNHDF